MVFVLAQVRIPPVLRMERYIADIQEIFRRAGYPRFGQAQTQEIALPGVAQGVIRVEPGNRWIFSDRAAKTAITLAPEFIVVSTTAYDTFEPFLGQLAHAMACVRDTVQVDFVERIGLRYVDLVRPVDEDSLEQYFTAGLTGLDSAALGVGSTESRFEQTATTDVGRLVFRLSKSDGRTYFPPDLLPLELEPTFDFEEEGSHAVLDFDHFSRITRDFDIESILEIMWSLHDIIGSAFRAAVTGHALDRWGRESDDGG